MGVWFNSWAHGSSNTRWLVSSGQGDAPGTLPPCSDKKISTIQYGTATRTDPWPAQGTPYSVLINLLRSPQLHNGFPVPTATPRLNFYCGSARPPRRHDPYPCIMFINSTTHRDSTGRQADPPPDYGRAFLRQKRRRGGPVRPDMVLDWNGSPSFAYREAKPSQAT